MRNIARIFNLCFCLFLSLAIFQSCGKNEGGNESNPLNGTMWVYTYTNYISKEPVHNYLEFTSNNTVVHWNTNDSIRGTGTYTISGNTVTFNNLKFKVALLGSDMYVFKSATFTNNSMHVSYDSTEHSLGHDMTRDYIKK